MIPAALDGRLRMPAIVSPMFLISSPDLVVESSRAGVIGSFPAFNQRTSAGYEDWLKDRSEEHTSELQSLMRTSYAVFCLKKKIKHKLFDDHIHETILPPTQLYSNMKFYKYNI